MTSRPSYHRIEVIAGAGLVTAGLVALGVRALVTPSGPPVADARPARLDVNVASRDALMVLPGLGEATADRIIARRPYRSVDDLRPVLGDALFESVRGHLEVSAR